MQIGKILCITINRSIITNCSLHCIVSSLQVCKRFLSLCASVKISELHISDTIENIKYYWFLTRKQCNHKDAIDVPRFTVCKSIFRLNECLKRLHLSCCTSDSDLLNLNHLTQLEELRLDVKHPGIDTVIHLSLPNLNVLEICTQVSPCYYLTTPKLKMFKCVFLFNIRFADYSTIDHLEVNGFTEDVRLLKNVQFLKAGHLLHRDVCLDILSVFPKLTTLVCEGSYSEHYSAEIAGLRQLVEQKLKKSGLKIYLESVELIDNVKVDEYESGKSNLVFQISNYNSLSEHSRVQNKIDYNELMRLVGGVLPDDFYNKFFNIEEVVILDEVDSVNHMWRFLKRLDYLSKLCVDSTVLDQSFYDGLYELGQLTMLEVTNSPLSIVNYDFLFNLKRLRQFYTNDDLDLFDLALQLFRNTKHFRRITFDFKGACVTLSTCNYERDRYSLNRSNSMLNFDQLVRKINAYKIKRSNSRKKRKYSASR